MQQSINVIHSVVHYILQKNCTYVHAHSEEYIEIMRVMVETWLVHVGLSISALQKRYISEKCSKMSVLRFPKRGPSVKMCFGFWASFGLEWEKRPLFKKNRKKTRV